MSIDLTLDPEIRTNLPAGGGAFLSALADDLSPEYVRSVLLFGSVISGEATDLSDIDLLVVLEADTPDGYRAHVSRRCDALARHHLQAGSTTENRLERMIDKSTGMFRSGFVTTVADVEQGRFHRVFDTSRLAYLVAPWRTVLASVFASATAIYGPSVAPCWDAVAPPSGSPVAELLRSWLMTGLLAGSQVLYLLVSPRALQYALEAYKWATYSCAFHLRGEPASTLDQALSATHGPGWYELWFRSLRQQASTGRRFVFVLATPIMICVVHGRAIWTILTRDE